jgi:peptidoglycan hydrolase-like protein with peptidoglycan-binding domain
MKPRFVTTMAPVMAVMALAVVITTGSLDRGAWGAGQPTHPPHSKRPVAASPSPGAGPSNAASSCAWPDAPPPELPTVTLDPGLHAAGEVVSDVQTSLDAAGTDIGPVDGVYGSGTAAGVASFLQAYTTTYPCTTPAADHAAASIVTLATDQDQLTAEAQAARAVHFSAATVRQIQSQCAGDFECFKACTIALESGGNYDAVSAGGTYRGAWQFDQRTWDANAEASGHPELVGQDPATASPSAQDAVAASTYQSRGNQAWGGRC